jgi:hypothetical protein
VKAFNRLCTRAYPPFGLGITRKDANAAMMNATTQASTIGIQRRRAADSWEDFTMATIKCQHPLCSCQVKDKNYCSEKCQDAPKTPPGKCPCEHPDCKGH